MQTANPDSINLFMSLPYSEFLDCFPLCMMKTEVFTVAPKGPCDLALPPLWCPPRPPHLCSLSPSYIIFLLAPPRVRLPSGFRIFKLAVPLARIVPARPSTPSLPS